MPVTAHVLIVGRQSPEATGVRGEIFAGGQGYFRAVERAGGTPLMLPPIALSTGWFFLGHERAGLLNVGLRALTGALGLDWWAETGPVNIATFSGLIFVYTLYLVPFAYLLVAAAFRNFDSSLEEASRVAGAGSWRTFRNVSAPGIMPARFRPSGR